MIDNIMHECSVPGSALSSCELEYVTTLDLLIGNIHFLISSEYPIHLLPYLEKKYSVFRNQLWDADTVTEFNISLVREKDKIFSHGELICDNSDINAWSVYKKDNGRELVWGNHDRGGYLWRACIDSERLSATVYVSDDFIEEVDGELVIRDAINYPLDQLLYMYASMGHDEVLVHSAGCVVHDDIGLLFCGKSGAGKSTISLQLLNDDNFSLLSDDRVIIQKKDEYYFISGTPWPGDAGIVVNNTVPLRALFFLHQSSENRIEPITAIDAFKQILPVVTIPWHEQELLPDAIGFCESSTAAVPAFNIYFTREAGVAELIKEFITTLP